MELHGRDESQCNSLFVLVFYGICSQKYRNCLLQLVFTAPNRLCLKKQLSATDKIKFWKNTKKSLKNISHLFLQYGRTSFGFHMWTDLTDNRLVISTDSPLVTAVDLLIMASPCSSESPPTSNRWEDLRKKQLADKGVLMRDPIAHSKKPIEKISLPGL